MTKEKVLALAPGRELDALVAEKVMGYTVHGQFREKNGVRVMIDRCSTDISAAWEVAEQLQKQGYVVCIELLPYEETSVGVYEADPANQIAYAKSNKPAGAIAKAALLAVMEL